MTSSSTKITIAFILSLLAAASMWFYVDHILVGYQIADAAAHERPRGNLSDLYPRWLGARELLLHHRNPYSDVIAREIQQGYYGRVLDPSRPNDPKDQQGFAYPVYVVFLLAPTITLPFAEVRVLFHWFLVALTAASVLLWLRCLRWRLPLVGILAAVAFTLGSFPAVQGIKLQQLSLLVAALLAACAAALASGWMVCGGVLLALATIKPQLTWPFVAWMFLWALSDWRRRRNFAFSFIAMMVLLVGGAELILPGWLRMFVQAIAQYHRYTENKSVLDELVPWMWAGKIVAAGAVAATAAVLWKLRRELPSSNEFGRAVALMMALTVLIVPMYAPYNQVLLLPAVFALARDCDLFARRSQSMGLGFFVGTFALSWQWLASMVLCAVYLLGAKQLAFRGWWLPGAATFALPVIVFLLMFLDLRNGRQFAPAVQQEQK